MIYVYHFRFCAWAYDLCVLLAFFHIGLQYVRISSVFVFGGCDMCILLGFKSTFSVLLLGMGAARIGCVFVIGGLRYVCIIRFYVCIFVFAIGAGVCVYCLHFRNWGALMGWDMCVSAVSYDWM